MPPLFIQGCSSCYPLGPSVPHPLLARPGGGSSQIRTYVAVAALARHTGDPPAVQVIVPALQEYVPPEVHAGPRELEGQNVFPLVEQTGTVFRQTALLLLATMVWFVPVAMMHDCCKDVVLQKYVPTWPVVPGAKTQVGDGGAGFTPPGHAPPELVHVGVVVNGKASGQALFETPLRLHVTGTAAVPTPEAMPYGARTQSLSLEEQQPAPATPGGTLPPLCAADVGFDGVQTELAGL